MRSAFTYISAYFAAPLPLGGRASKRIDQRSAPRE
jgi:hypothetical protein